jgi:hypothetical protein
MDGPSAGKKGHPYNITPEIPKVKKRIEGGEDFLASLLGGHSRGSGNLTAGQCRIPDKPE